MAGSWQELMPPSLSYSPLQTVVFFVMGCEPGQGGAVGWTGDAVSLWGPWEKTQNRIANVFFFFFPSKSPFVSCQKQTGIFKKDYL